MNTSSVWSDSVAIEAFPPLKKNVEVDVVIVGAGITGVTAAFLAKKAGKTVALLDRGRIASVDTAFTTAHLTAVTDKRLIELKKTFGQDAARATWEAGMAAIDQIVLNIRQHSIDCDFHWVPGFLHASLRELDPKKIEELEAEATLAKEMGIKAEFLPAVPFFAVPGIKFSHQALFHPRKYLRALLEIIPGGGSYVFENTNADEISDQPLVVKSGSHKIKAEYLIVATHNPIMGITSTLPAMLFQSKLSLYTSYAISGTVAAGNAPVASFWDTATPYDYLRVDRRGKLDHIIFGGEDHKTGQEPNTYHPYAHLEKRLKTYFPTLEIDHRWSGQVIEASDGLPYIGEITSGQFVATGFAGNGMTFGTLSAMMAVDRLLGRTNPWQDLFAPDRTKLLGGLWTYLKENKDYPFYLLRDWLAKGEGDSLSALGRGEGKILKLKDQKVAAYKSLDGTVSTCSAVCTHLNCIVGWNDAEKTWDCPCHGSRFKPTGEVISGPAEEPLETLKVE